MWFVVLRSQAQATSQKRASLRPPFFPPSHQHPTPHHATTMTSSLAQGATTVLVRLLQEVANSTAAGGDDPPAAPDEGKQQCKMMGGKFGDLVQLSLAVVGIGGLVIKRFQEAHPRPWKIWGLDVGKQCLGSLYAHVLNMLLAIGLTSIAGGGDQCAWYFVNYFIDSSLGVLLCLILIKAAEWWAARKEAGSWQRNYIADMGNYGSPPQCRIWYWQTLIWLGIVTISKFGLFFFMIALRDQFGRWGSFLFKPLQDHPNAELIIVMVIVPGIFNVAQFWILDNLLKSSTTEVESPPLSPSKSQNFKVNYEPILEGAGGADGAGGGRRRKGSGGALDWFSATTSNSWNWGTGAPTGGPGQGRGAGGGGGGMDMPPAAGGGPGGASTRTFYKPPVQVARPLDPNVPVWMATSTNSTILPPRRPYDGDDMEANGGALA